MTSNNDKFLKPLKQICSKFETESDLNKHVTDLMKLIRKGAFYEYHIFIEFLEIFSRNQKIPANNVKEIFKILNVILHEGSSSKEACIGKLYNFLIKNRNRDDLNGEFIMICKFETEPKLEKPEIIFLISEILLRISQNTEQRKILYRNYETHLVNHGASKDLSLKLLQSFNRCIANLGVEKKWGVIEDLLKLSFLKVPKLSLPSEEAHLEFLTIFSFLARYGKEQQCLMKLCAEIAKSFSSTHENAIEKNCYEILSSTFSMCCDSFSEQKISDLYAKNFKIAKTQGTSILYQKTTSIVAKIFALKINNFEMTPGCFTAYHLLVVAFFHIFKNIKNEEGQFQCCSDVKRHEVHSVIGSVFNFATNLTTQEKFTAVTAKNLLYHVNYDLQICNDLKCKQKAKEMLNTYNRCYNIVYEYSVRSSPAVELTQYIHEYVKVLFKLWNAIPNEEKSSSYDPDILAWKFYDSLKTKEVAVIAANGIASLIKVKKSDKTSGNAAKKMMLKFAFYMREKTTLLGFPSAYDFRKSKQFDDSGFGGGEEISLEEFLHLEITGIFRYTPNENSETFGKLFTELCTISKTPKILAQTCQIMTDSMLKSIDIEKFKKVTMILEKSNKEFDLEVSLALAINNYYLFYHMHEATSSELKEDEKKAVEKLDLKKELENVSYVNESLRHFTDVVAHLLQCKDDLDKILSVKRLTAILNNMAIQYYVRGIKYKDIEAFTLLWHLCSLEENLQVLLNIATFFLDNHQLMLDPSGNYIRISKKIKPLTVDEVIVKLNKLVDEASSDFENQTETIQCYLLSYLLSLVVYNLSTKRKSDAVKRWRMFASLWGKKKIPEGSANIETIRSKIYFSLVEINMTCYNRCADNFLSIACGILMGIKTIDRDFSYQFYQIYNRISIKAINYSLNRLSDMSHYDVVMASLIMMASRKGYCLKVLELLSISIMRNLNMEKIDNAKAQLKDITKVLGLKEEILIETPSKFEAPVTMFDYEIQGVRKAAVEPESPIQCELSMIHEGHSSEMLRQLESFVHEASCNCEICKIPQLKFIMFQIGCHYSRLLWLINKSDTSMKFNDYAFETWQVVSDKLRRMKDCEFLMINKTDFAVFSIRWLLQCADTMITLSNFEEVEEIYNEVELLCTDNVPDHKCFKQALHCRKENLEFLMEHGKNGFKTDENLMELTYAKFIESRVDKIKPPKTKKPSKSPVLLNRVLSSSSIPKKPDLVYIDPSDENTVKVVRKTKKTTKTTGESYSTAKPPSKPLTSSSVIDLTHDTSDTSSSIRTRPTRRRML